VDLELALCSDVPNREQSFVCRLGFARFVKDLKRWGRGICVSVHEPLCPLCAARELLASAGGVRLGLSSPRTAAIHGSMDGFCLRFSNFPPSSRRLQNNSTVANLSVLGPRCETIHCLNFYLALCHLSCIINWPETIFIHLVPSSKRRFLNLQDPKSLLVWDTHRGIETTARLPFLAFRCYPRCSATLGRRGSMSWMTGNDRHAGAVAGSQHLASDFACVCFPMLRATRSRHGPNRLASTAPFTASTRQRD
jgi:hypothetical protein